MTEAEWLACRRPDKMGEFVGRWISPRKHRLCAVACCRRAWAALADPRLRAAVEAAERHADGSPSDAELTAFLDDLLTAEGEPRIEQHAAYSARFAASGRAERAAHHAAAACGRPRPAERVAQAGLIRDIVGNPFRPTAIDGAWRTLAVVQLAQPAYAERQLPSGHLDPARLAVLSDALEEAGYTDSAILEHLRSGGPHIRGCWPVDLLLKKS